MNDMKTNKNKLSPKQREELIGALKARFEKNLNRHKGFEWAKVQVRLEASAEKLWSLYEMERTGGEPDVVIACCGDTPTLEVLAAVTLLREHLPALKVRVANVVDLPSRAAPGARSLRRSPVPPSAGRRSSGRSRPR